MSILIKYNDNIVQLILDLNSSVKTLKHNINNVMYIPIEFQNLYYDSINLEDNDILSDLGIKSGFSLELILDINGGSSDGSRYKKSKSKFRWKWKKKRTRRLQLQRRKIRMRSR